MSLNFQELDCQPTPLGEISLRQRRLLQLGGLEVLEVKLGDEYLMSSLFHDVEVALADLGLAKLTTSALDVVVGGLGLGYTADAALKNDNVQSLVLVEYLEPVIDWHKNHLIPLGKTLTKDNRCKFVQGDFFALARSDEGFDPEATGRKFHAILLDIDHSPQKLLHSRHGSFYEPEGLTRLANHLTAGGVFALWSDDPPDTAFVKSLEQVFSQCEAKVVHFSNPLTGGMSANTVYIATTSSSNIK